MQLLSADTGWITYGNQLYWTKDGGGNWRDISPVSPETAKRGATLSNVFFRDLAEGWAIVSYPEQTPAISSAATTVYNLAHTRDSGTTWSFSRLSYPELPKWVQDSFAGPASLYFIDALHGWINMAFEGNAKPGKLLATEDGGRTWTWVNSPGFSGPILFNSLRDGWLLGYFGGEKLYATHDGCHSWDEIKLPPPEGSGTGAEPTYQGLPVFQDPRTGYVVAHYSESRETSSKVAIYATTNGGRTWRLAKALPESHETARSGDSSPAVLSVPIEESGAAVAVSYRGVTALTFADTAHGWALTMDGRLFATRDAGVTWRDIRPTHGLSAPSRLEPVVK